MKRTLSLFILLLLIQILSAEKNYTNVIQDLQAAINNSRLLYKHFAYDQLAYVVDTFGPRLWGSSNLEYVIDYMHKLAISQNFDNIRLEPVVNFTKWVRGKQYLTLLSPRPVPTKLEVTALGFSVEGNVTGEVIVIKDWNDLQARKLEVPGKIVLFNHPWVNYSVNGDYRVHGASRAARYGAKAMLVRSVTPSSIGSVHTGYLEYDNTTGRIPAAAITIEDADMFQRMSDRKQKIVVQLELYNLFMNNCNSNNVVFEITGRTYPDQIVLAGGHIDSWDTGSQTGANDDGGGFMTVFAAMKLLRGLGLQPQRTIRFIAWSGEQSGSPRDGAAQYLQRHRSELNKHIVGFQSDLGSSQLTGFAYTGNGSQIIKGILKDYMSLIGADTFSDQGQSADVDPLYQQGGVPMLRNLPKDTQDSEFYFRYHHSAGDSMSIMNPDEMDSNVLGIAGMLYILADLDKTVRYVPTNDWKLLRTEDN